jgi:hypothetical protein
MEDNVTLVIELLLAGFIIACVLLAHGYSKRNTCTYAKSASGDFEQDMMGGNRQWIPKLNASGLCQLFLLKQLCLCLLLLQDYRSQMHRNLWLVLK